MTAKTGGICGGIDAVTMNYFRTESDSYEVTSVSLLLRQFLHLQTNTTAAPFRRRRRASAAVYRYSR